MSHHSIGFAVLATGRGVAFLALTSGMVVSWSGGQALAQISDRQLNDVEAQIRALKAELARVKRAAASQDHALAVARARPPVITPLATQTSPVMPQIPAGYALVPALPGSSAGSVVLARAEPPPAKLPLGAFQIGAVTLQLGGYLTGDGVFRTRNDVNDIQSNFTTGIALANSPLHHEAHFVLSSRTSRLTGLVSAAPDEATKLRAYVSVDFQGAAPTANSNESNSWTPRLREGWLSYDRSDWGVQFLAGQAWSLLTMTRVGMDPLNVNTPQTIDPNYLPGFTYARQPQFRVMKSFLQGQYRLAMSVENPQTTYGGTTPVIPGSTINITNPGTGVNSNTTVSTATPGVAASGSPQYSNNFAPDLIAKATADYPFAHLEAFGIGRVFNDRVSQLGTGQSNTEIGGGGGAAALIHVIPKLLDVQVSGLAGRAISRYDPTQLPDSTIGSDGKPEPLPGWEALVGVVGHPVPQADVYAYAGTDQVSARYSNIATKGKLAAYGYGNPLYDNAGCAIEDAPASECVGNTSGVIQGTVGGWYRLVHGNYGTVQVGTQYSYTRRSIFQGIGPTPKAESNMVFFSFRYFPFQ